MITIDFTATGPAELIWDGTSDPTSPGWYVRYTARNGQRLDEILSGDDPDGGEELRAETQSAVSSSRRSGSCSRAGPGGVPGRRAPRSPPSPGRTR